MFRKCKSLTHIDDLHMNNTAYTNEMFAYCNNLISVNNMIFNNIRSMTGMFRNSGNLVHLSGVLNSNKTEYVRNLIANCPKLSNDSLNFIAYSLPYYNNITDTYRVATLDYVGFTQDQINNLNADAVNRVEERGWFAQPQIRVDYTFVNGVTGNNKILITDMNGQQQYNELYNVLQHSQLSNNKLNVKNIAIVGSTNNISDLFGLFWDYKALEEVNISINTSQVTDITEMFISCENLKKIPNFNTNNVIDARCAFSTMTVSGVVNVPQNMNLGKAIDVEGLFEGARIISTPNLNLISAETLDYLFHGCDILQDIKIFNCPNAMSMDSMVADCPNLTVDSLQNLMTMIPEVTNLNGCTTATNLEYLGLTQSQINNIPAKYLQLAADKHWNIPGYKARIKKDIIPALNNLGAFTQITGTNNIPMDIKYEANLGTNALVSNIYNKNYYESGMILNITQEVYDNYGPTLMTQLWYSSERSYDYLYINKIYTNGVEKRILNNIGGTQSGSETYPVLNMSYDLDINVGEQIKFVYRKDSSAQSGADMGMIQIFGMVEPNESYNVKYTYANGVSQTKNFE